LFMVAEIVGGLWANSLAVLTDAAHLLSDLAGFLISIFALWLASIEPTSFLSFGFHRAEILGALVSVLLIWLMTGVLVYEAIYRIKHPQEVNGKLMFIVATVGLGVNFVMGFILHQSGHTHSHGLGTSGHGHATHAHSHGGGTYGTTGATDRSGTAPAPRTVLRKQSTHSTIPSDTAATQALAALVSPSLVPTSAPLVDTMDTKHDSRQLKPSHQRAHSHGEDGHGHSHSPHEHNEEEEDRPEEPDTNINVRAAFIHVLGDAIQSIGVMIAAGLIWYNPKWRVADPICTFLFSILVLFTTVRLVRQSVGVLMEGVPEGINPEEVIKALRSVPGVLEVHDLHIWSLSVGKPSMSAHLLVDDRSDGVLEKANQICGDEFNIHHTTIQIEKAADRVACNPHYR